MTQLLEKAIESVRALAPEEQDAIAQLMLDELESERLWAERFDKSQPAMSQLADRAWSEHAAGKSAPLDPDTL